MSEEQWILPGIPGAEGRVDLPVPGEEFTPSGFIGQWTAHPVHRVWVECDSDTGNTLAKSEGCVIHRLTTNGVFLFFDTNEHAVAATKGYKDVYPNHVWHVESDRDRLFWFSDESKEKFKWDPNGDISIRSWRAKKYRHELQLIALPSAVAAAARCYFGADVQYDISELLERDVQTDSFFEKMCGHPDSKKATLKDFQEDLDLQMSKGVPYAAALESSRKTQMIPVEYSELYLRRAVLWKELGEDDPSRYTVNQFQGEGDKRKPAKTNTEAPKLAGCLGIIQPWTEARWARVIMVPDPRMDATRTGEDDTVYRNTLPVFVDFYKGEAEAKAAFEALRRTSGEEGEGSGKPSLPESWADLGEQAFKDALVGLWGGPPAVVATKMGCSVEQAQAWGEYWGLP